MQIRPMRDGDREAVLDLLERAFGERESFARFMDRDPDYDPDDFLLALEAGRPVSCVQVFTKRVRLRGEAVALGGVGSVATDPGHRKRGLASELVRRTEQRMRERGMAIGLLFATLPDFYERLGWVRIPARELALHRPERPPALPGGVALRTFDEGADLAQVSSLYDSYSSAFEGTTVRDARYWRGQLRYAGSPDDGFREDFRVAERDGRIVAYARAIRLVTPQAMEYAHAPGEAGALAALLVELCPDAEALLVRLPPGTELEPELRGVVARADPVDDPTPHWRVLDHATLARLAGLPARSPDAAILAELIVRPRAHYWISDRF